MFIVLLIICGLTTLDIDMSSNNQIYFMTDRLLRLRSLTHEINY